jgi:hypothetical protein
MAEDATVGMFMHDVCTAGGRAGVDVASVCCCNNTWPGCMGAAGGNWDDLPRVQWQVCVADRNVGMFYKRQMCRGRANVVGSSLQARG